MSAPKLRFKEFDGDWNLLTFSDVFKFYNTNSYSRALLEENGEIMNIHYGDIHTKFSMLFDVEKEKTPYLSKEIESHKINEDNFLKVGDLVIADASEDYKDIGKTIEIINLNNKKVVAGLHTYIARPLKPFALGFNGYLMQTHTIRTQIQKLATGISVLGISKTNISKVELYLPSPEEQTKIASFLSAVDEKISQLTQKHQLLSQYKQGMMQKLFSQQIRFKADDGSEFGEWKTEKIGNITETIFGYPFDSKDMVDDSNGISLMRGINIGERHIRHTPELDRFFIKNPSKLEKYFVRENDIVLSMDGSKVGRNAAFVSRKDANSLLVQRVCILRENTFSNIKYIYQWIISNHFHRYVDQVKTSSGIPHISGKQIQEYEIDYPPLEEQTKIANFLSAIDQKIDVTTEQLEQAKLWKKGLLQQMFV